MKRFSKLLSIVLLGTSLMAVTPLEANAAWKKDNNGWWYTEGNSYVKNSWKYINGKWYYFDNSGYMKTGWLKEGSSWYYLYSNGECATGWVKSGSNWYYMNSSGVMQTGWIQAKYDYYYLDNNGAMQTGWIKVDDEWYFAQPSGAIKVGWFDYDGNSYYLAPYDKGKMERDVWMHDGYYLNSEGICDDYTNYHVSDLMKNGEIICESGRKLVIAGGAEPLQLMNDEPTKFCMDSNSNTKYFIGFNTLNVYNSSGQVVDKVTLAN